MMTGYQVVPETLRNGVDYLREAGDHYALAAECLQDDALFQHFDLGLLGEAANYVEAYNTAVDHLVSRLRDAQQHLHDGADGLDATAKHYEDQEYTWYKKFGYDEGWLVPNWMGPR